MPRCQVRANRQDAQGCVNLSSRLQLPIPSYRRCNPGFSLTALKLHGTCEVLAALGAALGRAKLDRVGWRWFVATGNDSGLLACIACMKRHLDSKVHVAAIIDSFARQRLSSLFATHLRAVMPSPLSYMALAHDLLEPMATNRDCMDAMVRGGVIDLIIGKRSPCRATARTDVRGTALSLLCENGSSSLKRLRWVHVRTCPRLSCHC